MPPVSSCWPRLWPLIAVFALAGCAAIQQPQPQTVNAESYRQHLASLADIQQFKLQGRIGVQNEGRGFSGSTRWQHDGAGDNIELFSPLGGQVATIRTTADGVQLTDSDGKNHSAKDAETLTQQTLGWSLPMQGLPDWALGRPAHGTVDIASATWDREGRLTRLKQDGWEIEYPEYRETAGHHLPARITLRSPKLYLKLVIEQWEIGQETLK